MFQFSEEQKKEKFSTRKQYFYIVHKLCVSWTFFFVCLFVSIALFIVCKIKTVLHLLCVTNCGIV